MDKAEWQCRYWGMRKKTQKWGKARVPKEREKGRGRNGFGERKGEYL